MVVFLVGGIGGIVAKDVCAKTVIARSESTWQSSNGSGPLRCGTIADAICGTASPVGVVGIVRVVKIVSKNSSCPLSKICCP